MGSSGGLAAICELPLTMANGRKDITDAETCIAAFENGASIRGATVAILRPVRGDDLESRNKTLTHYHWIISDRENDAF